METFITCLSAINVLWTLVVLYLFKTGKLSFKQPLPKEESKETVHVKELHVDTLLVETKQPVYREFKYPTTFSDKNYLKNQRHVHNRYGYDTKRCFAKWSQLEDDALAYRVNFEAMNIAELAKAHQRSISSIKERLKLLGLRIQRY